MDDRTPVIVGVGEASERVGSPSYAALSPVSLAALAATAALADAGAPAAQIELIAAIRQFEISHPKAVAPFGRSDNFPRSVARRIGADPRRAILEVVGGQGPQHLVNDVAQQIGRGELDLALLVGAEAISTVRHLLEQKETRDWSEAEGGQLEDRGMQTEGQFPPDLQDHGVRTPVQAYALFENARRGRQKLDRAAYALEMGKLLAPFTRVAAENEHAMSRRVLTAEEIATLSPENRMVADPFPRRVVSRDQANQGAAVLLASARKARELRIVESRWVYLHGGADVAERSILERQDLGAFPAAGLASRQALEIAGIDASNVRLFDLYSCFPIAVFSVRDELGIAANDRRDLTVAGGLPFFGGAGSNYAMHAIARLVQALRSEPGAFGFVGANGGNLSKYSVGVYSTRKSRWRGFDSRGLQAEVDSWRAPLMAEDPADAGRVETYMIDYGRAEPHATLVCRTAEGRRFLAMTDGQDRAIADRMARVEPLGAAVTVRRDERGRRIVTRLEPAVS